MASRSASQAPRSVITAAHVHRVKVVYRRIIKNHLNWSISRDHWLRMVSYTREKFEHNKNLTDESLIHTELRKSERWIEENRHPDPYIPPSQQSGVAYQRNVPPPYEIKPPPQKPFVEEPATEDYPNYEGEFTLPDGTIVRRVEAPNVKGPSTLPHTM
jgi:NADH dehydrogenase (ubiquinone) 1 beta subcomplex subunit 9